MINFEKFFLKIGEDPNREGLRDTPKRIKKLYESLFDGYHKDIDQALGSVFNEEHFDSMITLKDMEFYSMCEHHLLPFFGKIHIGYIPNEKLAGIGGLARLVDIFAHRLQIQERFTNQIADILMQKLSPKGVMVTCEATHLCMRMQGMQKQHANIHTSAVRGIFKTDSRTRSEFIAFVAAKS
ncbi:GTP cyclohydrolase I FolE [Helicobacter mustelae]|uniref:GTP cyclohydrolase 1 n=1 Tax=Helicobacter mustelae (strain ATCC 43772 / CCUG 25715 / CIP 103759 / LMG 18044 / NCTC 12198 / R85-136P) TaxID=679897 RepID=D3UJ19_HELM1|nr:GTP cyclohydrolase I FolE [Helicobacter mustelae]CBG40494.1 GTP cyclohydrolase I [Helicobacter mustelae 12198]SQH71993.1 GTP cyclohydrolase I [Helicobacter mustelae]STP13136.1 GTP cyclohydrolase I [Helicobacter mustelae]